jgi:outer membrane biosynthesis protein TonB
MKSSTFAPLVVLSVALLAAGAEPAWAQQSRVVVQPFKGPGAAKAQKLVTSALQRSRWVVSIQTASGRRRVENANVIVRGSTSKGRKMRFVLTVSNGEGALVGDATWTEASAGKLMSRIKLEIDRKLNALLEQAGSSAVPAPDRPRPERAVASPVADAQPAERPAPRKPIDDPLGSPTPPPAPPPPPPSHEEPAPPPPERSVAEVRRRSAPREEEEAEPPRSSTGREQLPTGALVSFLTRAFSRDFSYNQNIYGPQQPYKVPKSLLPEVLSPGLAIEYFPIGYVGVSASATYALNTVAKDTDGNEFKTTAYSYVVALKGRIPAGPVQVEPSVGYGSHVFKLESMDESVASHVAGVDYKHVRIGGGVRVPFARKAAVTAGGYFLRMQPPGEILDPDKYFYGEVRGGEGYAGVEFPIAFLEGSVTADLRRLVYTFDVVAGEDSRVAGGAVDQYIGINLAVGYRFGGK